MLTEMLFGSRQPAPLTRASLENPNVSLNDPETWEQIFGHDSRAYTGESVNVVKALSYAPVWQAVSLISGDVAKLPLCLVQEQNGSEITTEIENDPREFLTECEPNQSDDAVTFWQRAMVHALLWGNAYLFIDRSRSGAPVGLYTLLPDRTAPAWASDGTFFYASEIGGKMTPLLPGDVMHIRGLGHERGASCNLVEMARNSIGLGLAQEKFSSKFFKNGGRVGGVLELPAAVSKMARDTIEEGFRKTYEDSDNPFKTVILRDNAKFHAAQTSPRDAQMVEGTEAQVRQIARWFNLPPSKLGLSDSVSYNSKSEDNRAYLDGTLQIWLTKIESQTTHKLLSRREREGGLRFQYETAALLKLSQHERYNVYDIAIRTRVMNPNEIRALENMPPYDGGDEFLNPNTTANAGAEAEPPGTPAEDTAEPPEPKAQGQNSVRDINRLRVLVHLGETARYRARKSPASFLAWIDHGAPDHREQAIQLVGSDEIVDGVLAELKSLAERVTAADLVAAVDQKMTALEQEPLT